MTHRVCIDVATTDRIAHLKLVRPEAYNSMISEFWSELPEIIGELDAGGEARAIVISSTGKHFTSGMDVTALSREASRGSSAEPGRVRADLRREILRLQQSFSCLERARIPVLAAVQGGCVGGGVDMISACDIRYCSADAFFCIQEINLGMTADVGTFPRLPQLIPHGLVRELAYTGRRLSAEEARGAGLVNRVWPTHEELVAGVLDIAREIATRSPLAIWGSKEMLNYARDHTIAEGLDYVATWQSGMFHPADMQETFAAKAEKREPEFEDLLPVKKRL